MKTDGSCYWLRRRAELFCVHDELSYHRSVTSLHLRQMPYGDGTPCSGITATGLNADAARRPCRKSDPNVAMV